MIIPVISIIIVAMILTVIIVFMIAVAVLSFVIIYIVIVVFIIFFDTVVNINIFVIIAVTLFIISYITYFIIVFIVLAQYSRTLVSKITCCVACRKKRTIFMEFYGAALTIDAGIIQQQSYPVIRLLRSKFYYIPESF